MAVTPYYESAGITIYHGDCREIAPSMACGVAAVISDPPYGMRWDGRVSVGAAGHGAKGSKSSFAGQTIVGDDTPFDPSPWLEYRSVVLFGSNHYGQRLPVGTTLVWIKRFDAAFGSFLSDAEVAWMKGGHGVYCFRDLSMRAHETERAHPSQKPIPLMEWCIGRASVPPGGTLLDPYMGSGTTLVAAKNLGRRAIGIEIEERYCEIAARRLDQEVLAL